MAVFLLGLDVGSSSVKACVVDARTGLTMGAAQSPAEEMTIHAPRPGWAEQQPQEWWHHTVLAIRRAIAEAKIPAEQIKAVGIAYQMHGLVAVDHRGEPVRPSIIWCDSRAVDIGERAMKTLGVDYTLQHLLNSPGNFTASKLRWVRENEADNYRRIHKIMLPGDYIAFRLSGAMQTTDTGLSEGILWDFHEQAVSAAVLAHYEIDVDLIAERVPVFAQQAVVSNAASSETGLTEGTVISYRAGDQPNNAFSLGVLNPGETAATAGTSGVIYAVADKAVYDTKSRVNTFVHVNNTEQSPRNGVLLCLNGAGILNQWVRRNMTQMGYEQMNQQAAAIPVGADGLCVLPFGNGAERILENKLIDAGIYGLDFNRHTNAHVMRAAQEGVVFALRYGFSILEQMGLNTKVIRAGKANMFLSRVFTEAFANSMQASVELYNVDGAKGAACGAGVGAGIHQTVEEAFTALQCIQRIDPDQKLTPVYAETYQRWHQKLASTLTTS